MAKNKLSIIQEFTGPKAFALIGLSRDPKKFSRAVYKELTAKGFEIYPVNPNMDDIDGRKCYHQISDLPGHVKHAVLMTPKANTAGVVENAASHGLTHIWLQQGSETSEARELAMQKGLKLVYGACIMMHTDPSGVHKFHRFLAKVFGAFPKN